MFWLIMAVMAVLMAVIGVCCAKTEPMKPPERPLPEKKAEDAPAAPEEEAGQSAEETSAEKEVPAGKEDTTCP